MKKVLILTASPRILPKEVHIPRNGYDVVVPGKSSCRQIEDIIVDKLKKQEDVKILHRFNIKFIHCCQACYACVESENNRCIIDDIMKNIYPYLEQCTDLIIITPLHYATIPAQLTAFFNRLYPYWIKSYYINPKTGFPNNYPKLNVYTLGTCADPWQDWKLFDDTLNHIYAEIGWTNKGIYHFPGFSCTDDEKIEIVNVSNMLLK